MVKGFESHLADESQTTLYSWGEIEYESTTLMQIASTCNRRRMKSVWWFRYLGYTRRARPIALATPKPYKERSTVEVSSCVKSCSIFRLEPNSETVFHFFRARGWNGNLKRPRWLGRRMENRTCSESLHALVRNSSSLMIYNCLCEQQLHRWYLPKLHQNISQQWISLLMVHSKRYETQPNIPTRTANPPRTYRILNPQAPQNPIART